MANLSFDLMDWAARQDLPPGQKAVLKELSRRADMLGTCFPSQKRIAADTGMGERTVRRHIAALEKAGFITRERRQSGYIRRSDCYMINAPVVREMLRLESEETAANLAAAQAAAVAGAEPAKLAAAKELPPELPELNSDFSGGRGTGGRRSFREGGEDGRSNPPSGAADLADLPAAWPDAEGANWAPDCCGLTVTRGEYRALSDRFFPGWSLRAWNPLQDVLDRHAAFIRENPHLRRKWRGLLLRYLERRAELTAGAV